MQTRLITVCRQRQGAEKRDQVNFYLTRGRGNIYPTDDYIIEHVMLANKDLSSIHAFYKETGLP